VLNLGRCNQPLPNKYRNLELRRKLRRKHTMRWRQLDRQESESSDRRSSWAESHTLASGHCRIHNAFALQRKASWCANYCTYALQKTSFTITSVPLSERIWNGLNQISTVDTRIAGLGGLNKNFICCNFISVMKMHRESSFRQRVWSQVEGIPVDVWWQCPSLSDRSIHTGNNHMKQLFLCSPPNVLQS